MSSCSLATCHLVPRSALVLVVVSPTLLLLCAVMSAIAEPKPEPVVEGTKAAVEEPAAPTATTSAPEPQPEAAAESKPDEAAAPVSTTEAKPEEAATNCLARLLERVSGPIAVAAQEGENG